jgi:hypothetical protein
MLGQFSLFKPKRALMSVALSGFAAAACAAPALARTVPASDSIPHAVSSVYSFANTDGYMASEDVGNYPLIITRTNADAPGVVCWGVTNKGDEAGAAFTKIAKQHVEFTAGQASATVDIVIHDQGLTGPPKYARAYMYGCGLGGSSATPNETITLLQNDSAQARDPSNILGYAQPTDGDPLQNVDWYVFGNQIAAGQAADRYKRSNPAWSKGVRRPGRHSRIGVVAILDVVPAHPFDRDDRREVVRRRRTGPARHDGADDDVQPRARQHSAEQDQEPLRAVDHPVRQGPRQQPSSDLPRGGRAHHNDARDSAAAPDPRGRDRLRGEGS